MKELLNSFILELPIQKCKRGEHVKNLSNTELLAILLGTGSRKNDVMELAATIFRHFSGLRGIYDAGLKELSDINGVGLVKALKIKSAFEMGKRVLSENNDPVLLDSPEKVWSCLRAEMALLKHEIFMVLLLNNKNHLIKKCTASMGTVSEALVHPREIFREAVRENASSVILAHNHPSNVLLPSTEDIKATKRLKDASTILGIELLDHVIIGSLSYLSLKEYGSF